MPIPTMLIMVLGGGVLNMIVSAVANQFDGADVGRCARSGLAGGIAGGIFSCLFALAGLDVSG
ncbi:MAG TPA: hypothetical protein VIT88_00125 [Pyrinomonadaceae bacterium]